MAANELNFSAKISTIRQHFGLSQDGLAARLGVSGSAIGFLQTGRTKKPSAELLASFTTELGINPHWLLTGEGEMLLSSAQALNNLPYTTAGEKKWSQAQVAEAAGLTRNMITRMEQFGGGGIDVLQTLLTFYYERGYNPSWVLIADNSRLSKRLPLDGVKSIPVTDVVTQVLQFQQRLHQQFDEMERDLLQ